jgi:uncharacterized membrane protein YjgN (DUF898 family)
MSAVTQQPPPPQPPQQPPFGGQPPNPYGPPPVGFGAPEHPQATTVLILGILGLVLCGVLAPFAWVMGNRVVREIDASPGRYGGRSSANAGRICGIVGTILLGFSLLIGVGGLAVLLIAAASSSTS